MISIKPFIAYFCKNKQPKQMHTHIVSRNYRNRESDFKWLARERDEQPTSAIETKELYLSDFKFEGSSEYESGFGCGVVAKGVLLETAPEFDLALLVQIHFDGHHAFYINGNQIPACRVGNGKLLILKPDGSIYCVR